MTTLELCIQALNNLDYKHRNINLIAEYVNKRLTNFIVYCNHAIQNISYTRTQYDNGDIGFILNKTYEKQSNLFTKLLMIYHENTMDDFYATKYLSGFFSCDISKILKEFSFANCIKNYTYEEIPNLCEILDIALIQYLSTVFSKIKFFVDNNCEILLTKSRDTDRYLALIQMLISNEQKNISYDDLIEDYPAIVQRILKSNSKLEIRTLRMNRREGLSRTGEIDNDIMVNFISNVIELYTKSKNAFENKKCIIDDIDIMGLFGTELDAERDYLRSDLIFLNFFKHIVISKSNTKTNFKPIIISGLFFPKQHKKVNKKVNKIVIEI